MVNLHDFSLGQLTLECAKKMVKGNATLKETNFTNLFRHVQKTYITVENTTYYIIIIIMNERVYVCTRIENAATTSTCRRVVEKTSKQHRTRWHT